MSIKPRPGVALEFKTEDEVVAFGQQCGILLETEAFKSVFSHIRDSITAQTFATAPESREERECLYHARVGLDTIESLLTALAERSRALLEMRDEGMVDRRDALEIDPDL